MLAKSLVFQGGNWNHLHRLLGLRSGANLMYVGDHMYSDILRSKRTLGWRTVLIVPELDNEMEALQRAEDMQVLPRTPNSNRKANPNPNPSRKPKPKPKPKPQTPNPKPQTLNPTLSPKP